METIGKVDVSLPDIINIRGSIETPDFLTDLRSSIDFQLGTFNPIDVNVGSLLNVIASAPAGDVVTLNPLDYFQWSDGPRELVLPEMSVSGTRPTGDIIGIDPLDFVDWVNLPAQLAMPEVNIIGTAPSGDIIELNPLDFVRWGDTTGELLMPDVTVRGNVPIGEIMTLDPTSYVRLDGYGIDATRYVLGWKHSPTFKLLLSILRIISSGTWARSHYQTLTLTT